MITPTEGMGLVVMCVWGINKTEILERWHYHETIKYRNVQCQKKKKKRPLEQSILSSRSQPLTPISTGLLPSGTAMATARGTQNTQHSFLVTDRPEK